MIHRRKFYVTVALLVGVLMVFGTWPAQAGPQGKKDPKLDIAKLELFWQGTHGSFKNRKVDDAKVNLLAKADPDECFYGVGDCTGEGPGKDCKCADDGIPKRDQAYVWGLTKPDSALWFGTGPNVHCMVLGLYLGITDPHVTNSWVCEFGQSCVYQQYAAAGLPAGLGDWRPPDIFSYDTKNNKLVEKTDLGNPYAQQLLNTTVGIRSAGSIGDLVILGGPALPTGVNLFAFNAATGDFVGATQLPQYSNIRKWVEVNGEVYTGMRSATGGEVLRWTGNLTDPFQYEVVGVLESEPAELAEHEGRLFVSTWSASNPEAGGGVDYADLYMSPPFGEDGMLTDADQDGWTKVWEATDYEPDPVTAATYGGGALASFGGYLYWGTMHVPFLSAVAHLQAYGPSESQEEALATILGTYRAINIFRGHSFGTVEEDLQVAYGQSMLPAYIEGEWQIVPTKMGPPLYGPSGFGNFFNNYTWTMEVYNGKLYVGTMDFSYPMAEGLPIFVEYVTGAPLTIPLNLPSPGYGADLFAFPSSSARADAVSVDGVGNYLNYGIRTMVSDDALYLGMANPMNLEERGGWELLRLTTK